MCFTISIAKTELDFSSAIQIEYHSVHIVFIWIDSQNVALKATVILFTLTFYSYLNKMRKGTTAAKYFKEYIKHRDNN